MDKIKLKPCPFCGEKAVVASEPISFEGERTYYIRCSVCGVQMGYCNSAVNLVQAWNKRTPEKNTPSE